MPQLIERETFLKEFGNTFGPVKDAQKALETIEKQGTEGLAADRSLRVATIAIRLGLEKNTVLAAILHDAAEKGEKIESTFGKEISDIIDSKIRFEKALTYTPHESEIARKKMSIVLTTNPGIVMLHLSEMLDKLRNIDEVPDSEKKNFVNSIKEVYAPLAHKLGIYSISSEMNDLAFKHENPEAYMRIEREMEKIAKQTNTQIEKAKATILEELRKNGIKATVAGRIKTVYSTFSKMQRKNILIEKVYDLIALRVITGSVKECYEALGILHSTWKPIPGEFDDYIAKPKDNGYSSLHTSVYTEDAIPIEIQIRTKEMHDFSEFGIASHWKYKGERKDSKYDKKIEWIKQVIEWERQSKGNTDLDIFGKEVFAMTPKGEVIELPEGATVIDFAYAVHSDIGDKCMGAKINSTMVPLDTPIKNGEVVEIVTSSKQTPKMNWLTFAKSPKARQKIMSKLRIEKGRGGTKKLKSGANAIKTTSAKVRLAKCCTPLPGEQLVGIKTTKRKISVHRHDCPELEKINAARIEVMWDERIAYYDTNIVVKAKDRLGILRDLLEVFSKNKIYLGSTNAQAGVSNTTLCKFTVRLRDIEQLEQISNKISRINGVLEVYRE